MQTFKSVLGNIIDEVAKKFGYNKEQLGQVIDRSVGNSTSADSGTILQETLAKLIKPQIVSGLSVRATVPPSLNVIVYPGYGSAQGILCELKTTQQVTIDNNFGIYYVLLNGSRVIVSSDLGLGLPLAKIIIPNPGVTNKILDDSNDDSEYDGYIILGNDLLFNNDFVIDDESIGQLKNTMNKIFAEYIFGTIKLNESLQITNEQGTLRADSDSVNFYDVNGNELASYGAHEARVGNIKVTPSTIQSRDFQEGSHGFRLKDDGDAEFDDIVARGTMSSPDFTPGFSGKGWKIDRDGSATFNNGIFRGELHTSVFVKDSISATNGNLIVTNATVLTADIGLTDTSISVKEAVFAIGDRVKLQPDATRSEYMSIDSVSGLTYGVTRDLDGSGANTFQAGDAVVGQGSRVEIVASGDIAANLPYIDVIKRNTTTWDDTTTMARLGNLAGINDAQFGQLTGYGLYTNNGYFTGSITSSNINGGIISGTIINGVNINTEAGIGFVTADGYIGGKIFAQYNATTQDTVIKFTGPIALWPGSGYIHFVSPASTTPDVVTPMGGMVFYGWDSVYANHLCLYNGSEWRLLVDISTTGDMSGINDLHTTGDVYIEDTKKLYLDGGGNTYIFESSADEIGCVAGGTQVLTVKAAGIEVPTGKFLAFNAANSVYLKEQSTGSLLAYSTTFYRSSNGSAFDTTSDIRLKTNILPLPSMLEKISLLKPSIFEYKENELMGHIKGVHMGFIANDVEQVFPEWVDTGTDEQHLKSLNMEGINAVLVKAIQELNNEIDTLKQQVKDLMEKSQ